MVGSFHGGWSGLDNPLPNNLPKIQDPKINKGIVVKLAPVVEVMIPVGEVLIKLSQLFEGSAV